MKMREVENTVLGHIEKLLGGFFVERGAPASLFSLERASHADHGDLSTSIALSEAKRCKENPMILAESVAQYFLSKNDPYIKDVQVASPGFVNIYLSQDALTAILNEVEQEGDTYGENKMLKGEKWVIEHTSPNPNKAMHLGHLRNNLIGISLVRLLKLNGAEVVSEAVDNNRGIAIAKVMWGFLLSKRKNENAHASVAYWNEHKDEWHTPQEQGVLPDIFVTDCYMAGEQSFKSSQQEEEKVRTMVIEWEHEDALVWELWRTVLSYAYEGMERTLTRLGNHFDNVWHEHEHYKEGKEYVDNGLKSGVFTLLEDGAVLTNLSSYNIPDTIVRKRDGTALYITQDIALTAKKRSTYNANKLVWVIGPDQTLAMKQLFAVCEQLGIGSLSDFTHVPYGYVGLKDLSGAYKKMSSREGTTVLIDEVIDEVSAKIRTRFIEEEVNEGEALDALCETLALGAVKFSFLKSDRNQRIDFDAEHSIQTSGDSGLHVVYTYVRTQSILRKARNSTQKNTPHEYSTAQAQVIKLLGWYPRVVVRATHDQSVHHIAQYLLELCGAFNAWYATETILDGSEKEEGRVKVVSAVGSVIKNALTVLGIDTVEEI